MHVPTASIKGRPTLVATTDAYCVPSIVVSSEPSETELQLLLQNMGQTVIAGLWQLLCNK